MSILSVPMRRIGDSHYPNSHAKQWTFRVYSKVKTFLMEYYMEPKSFPTEVFRGANDDIFTLILLGQLKAYVKRTTLFTNNECLIFHHKAFCAINYNLCICCS